MKAVRFASSGVQRRWSSTADLKKTVLNDFHASKGCKFVDFAGYAMPVQYNGIGVVKEHTACREGAALFDVSHMGQWVVHGPDREKFLEALTTIDYKALEEGMGSLTVITTDQGGIVDDTIIVKQADTAAMVVNAGCQDKDFEHATKLLSSLGLNAEIERLDRGLVALQGPKAAEILSKHCDISSMPFMAQRTFKVLGDEMVVTRCGYTGEDGFEISASNSTVAALCEDLVTKGATLAGLGARDSLRLEAGLCLYGNDMDENVTPIEASLAWLISKRRREERGFTGADRIMTHLTAKPKEEGAFKQKRVCLEVTGPPAREGAVLKNAEGVAVGRVTSGTFSPTLRRGIAMGYVNRNLQKAGTELFVEVRNKLHKAVVTKAPFVPHNYVRL
eukprot:TRINITY_DN74277_c0_g1_i1.p1 TRINITY_DN74277_c0_g1~~TRINITY_DN74277_c0_g1_i1.p1  ORF type:complete len:390 (+),score=183.71 TRINITY_DN74277_c0_g1_i1:48-1217(+)